MTDLRWQPLPGTTVVSIKQWNKIPPRLHPALEDAARKAGADLQKRIRQLEQDAIVAMKNHGLTVHEVPPQVEQEWHALVREKAYPVFVGPRFSKEMFDTVRSILDEYRQSKGLQTLSKK